MVGKGTLLKLGDLVLKSDYPDDMAFFYGTHRLYFRRHILRVFADMIHRLSLVLAKTPGGPLSLESSLNSGGSHLHNLSTR